jgi:predicted nucleic acid-binding protein
MQGNNGAIGDEAAERQPADDSDQQCGAGRVDAAVARRSAALHGPDSQPFRDGLIAAPALVHNLVVATRNQGDFRATGVRLLNPWQQR